jgi:hypothetical protein
MTRRAARILLYAAIVAAVMLSTPPAGRPAGGRGPWRVASTVRHCPLGFLCKRWSALEPNYGQALKLEHELELEGFAVWLVQVPA